MGLLVLVAVALGLAMFSWLSIESMNDSAQRTLDERLTVARIVASHLDETLDHTLAQLQNQANYSAAEPLSPASFHARSGALLSLLTRSGIAVEGIFLLDPEGKVLSVEPDQPAAVGSVLPGYDGIEAYLDKGESRISTLVDAPMTGEPVVFAYAPIIDSANKKTGAISIAIDVSRSSIGGFIKPIRLGNTGYIEIVDSSGLVLARTEPGQPPAAFEKSDHPGRFAQLMAEGKATVRTCHVCHGSESQIQRRKDVLAFAPLSNAPWGIAIRQSEDEAFALTEQLKKRFFVLGGIVVAGVVLVMWVMLQDIVGPIKQLTAGATRVAAGDFKALVPLRRRDEIGQLSRAFAGMADDLARVQDELVASNRELTALNSMAATVSQSLDLEDILIKALQRLMEVTGAEAGCVFLGDLETKKMKLATSIGASDLFRCEQSESAFAQCACHQVLRSGRTSLANDVTLCPALGNKPTTSEQATSFVSVPLKSKKKVLGIMNLAYSGDSHLTERDLRLLDSIGRQVGLAVENSSLYLDAKRHEEVRGQLLTALISAQEDERKRLSRELHDQAGQSLTSLVMSIDHAESAALPEQAELRKRLSRARAIGSHLLEDMRRMMQDLRSSVIDDLGLAAAIRSHAQINLEAAGVAVEFEATGLNRRLSPSLETALFRIAQEAMYNIVRHAQATTVKIKLEAEDHKVLLSVEDDGRGFELTDSFFGPNGGKRSFGLLGMRERVTLLGGRFSVRSEVGRGTHIMVEVPVDN
ncbi:MAG: GAF domain-containing protein [Dehalococcoidia bacterium]|nr:GAF domain-containing protein [Dehalococcoidia bacterium]